MISVCLSPRLVISSDTDLRCIQLPVASYAISMHRAINQKVI